MKYGFEDSILKCQSWPVSAKHPINVYFYAILVLLDHLNNITRNQDVFVGCCEIGISVIVEHVQNI